MFQFIYMRVRHPFELLLGVIQTHHAMSPGRACSYASTTDMYNDVCTTQLRTNGNTAFGFTPPLF